jgi:hypothetical protein
MRPLGILFFRKKILDCHLDVLCDLTQERGCDISSSMIWNSGLTAIRMFKLAM